LLFPPNDVVYVFFFDVISGIYCWTYLSLPRLRGLGRVCTPTTTNTFRSCLQPLLPLLQNRSRPHPVPHLFLLPPASRLVLTSSGHNTTELDNGHGPSIRDNQMPSLLHAIYSALGSSHPPATLPIPISHLECSRRPDLCCWKQRCPPPPPRPREGHKAGHKHIPNESTPHKEGQA